MLAQSTAQPLDAPALLALVHQTDPLGVLSIYVDVQPEGPGGGARASAIDIRNRLAELERRIRADGNPQRARALRDQWATERMYWGPALASNRRAGWVKKRASPARTPAPGSGAIDHPSGTGMTASRKFQSVPKIR